MTLAQVFLIYRYKVYSVHFVTPTEDNRRQTEGIKAQGIFTTSSHEVGEIIVADGNVERARELVGSDRSLMSALIAKAK